MSPLLKSLILIITITLTMMIISSSLKKSNDQRLEDSTIKQKRPIVFLELSIDEKLIGKIKIECFDDIVPKTCQNFVGIATREGSSYAGTKFHRVIPGFMIQAGDGRDSLFGGKFEDENFDVHHVGAGMVSMANAGADTNTAQFFITLVDCPWLDGKHVVFGKVVGGMEIVKEIEGHGSKSGKTDVLVEIVDSGLE